MCKGKIFVLGPSASVLSVIYRQPRSVQFLHRIRHCQTWRKVLARSCNQGNDEGDLDDGFSRSALQSGLSSARSGFIEVLSAIAISRFKADELEKSEQNLTNTSSFVTDFQSSSFDLQENAEDVGYSKLDLRIPGFSFSAAGLLFPYHLGVGKCLIEHGYITEKTSLSGSSAGAIVCAVIASGLSMEDAMLATKELASDCRKNGTAFRLGAVLRRCLEDCLPEDAHCRSSGRIRVAVTQLFQSPRALLVEHFFSKKDLIDALLTSSFIPGYLAPRPVTLYRKRFCIDGGLTSFMPPTAAEHTVRVCAFPATQLGLQNVGISPDCNPVGRASTRQLLKWALNPAAEDVLEQLFDLGYRDALVWVQEK
ncbi:hypothetical protein KP509_24G004200 [Ceratopteris richardii]|uniref:Patatin n=1 Tax=Ceratopteris richardii TaxID=49495 RepID=A0A8T2RSY5_CERRI|nr:hypothetical protein KP509_24G004200 [Ceratopteris richardii]